MVYGVVYGLYHPLTGELRYIGQTVQPLRVRLNGHLNPKNLCKSNHSARWLASLKWQNLKPIIVELGSAQSRGDLDQLEIALISQARTEGRRLTNHTEGGMGQNGRVCTAITRAKISAATKGRFGVWTGKHRSEETKDKLSAKCRGLNAGATSVHFRHDVTPQMVLDALHAGKTKTEVLSVLGVSNNLFYLRLRQARAAGFDVPRLKRGPRRKQAEVANG